MAFVVAAPCHDCKYTDCVVECPVDAFYHDEHMLYIDPETCICCGLCEPECPAEAIFDEPMVPTQWTQYVQLNAERTAALKGGVVDANLTRKVEPKMGPGCKR